MNNADLITPQGLIALLDGVDSILASYEDWMHGKDGDMCTDARKDLAFVIQELEKRL